MTGTTPATAASKRSSAPPLGGGLPELGPVPRDQLLVGADDGAPGAQRARDELERRVEPAHHLDDQVGAADHLVGAARGFASARR